MLRELRRSSDRHANVHWDMQSPEKGVMSGVIQMLIEQAFLGSGLPCKKQMIENREYRCGAVKHRGEPSPTTVAPDPSCPICLRSRVVVLLESQTSA